MKRITALLLAAVFAPALSALADNPHEGKNNNTKPSKSWTSPGPSKPAPAQRPVIINMTHPSSGGP